MTVKRRNGNGPEGCRPASRGRMALLALALALLPGLSARAADLGSGWQGIPEAEVRLIAGRTAAGQEMIALDFAIAPKWKVYWRSPGDAGYPPVADWSSSDGVTPGAISWPLPDTFDFWGLRTYGYADRLVLPVTMDQRDRSRPTLARLTLSYATCADICVPVEAELSLELPAGALPRNRHGEAIATALARTPAKVSDALRQARFAPGPDGGGAGHLALVLVPPHAITAPDVIIEGDRNVVFGQADCGVAGGAEVRCTVPVEGSAKALAVLPGSRLTVTLFGDGPSLETSGTVASGE